MVIFKNKSKIQTVKSDNTIRGYRSKLISFYCPYCDAVHVDYPIKDTFMVEDSILCKNILSDEEFITTP